MANKLSELVEGLVKKWHKQADTFEITCGDWEVEGAYHGCAAELKSLIPAIQAKHNEEIKYHREKWETYERDYILPLFIKAKERGFSLEKLVKESAEKNCVNLYVERMDAELAAVVEKAINFEYAHDFVKDRDGNPVTARHCEDMKNHMRSALRTPSQISALEADRARVRLEVLQEAAEIECVYCGGRMPQFTEKGDFVYGLAAKEVPFQIPNDNNWYHRQVSPCKAAPIHHVLKEFRASVQPAEKEKK